MRFQVVRRKGAAEKGVAWTPGSAIFQYANDQSAATLWYHDHTLGMTRLNVYKGHEMMRPYAMGTPPTQI